MSPDYELENKILAQAVRLTNFYGLGRYSLAYDAAGNVVHYRSNDISCLCTVGFVNRAAFEVYEHHIPQSLWVRVRAAINEPDAAVIEWSDRFGRTIEDVRALFEKALATGD